MKTIYGVVHLRYVSVSVINGEIGLFRIEELTREVGRLVGFTESTHRICRLCNSHPYPCDSILIDTWEEHWATEHPFEWDILNRKL